MIMIEDIRRIAAEAGEAIMKTYDGPAEVETKEDGSPLTQADRAAHECIATFAYISAPHTSGALKNIQPQLPVPSAILHPPLP